MDSDLGSPPEQETGPATEPEAGPAGEEEAVPARTWPVELVILVVGLAELALIAALIIWVLH